MRLRGLDARHTWRERVQMAVGLAARTRVTDPFRVRRFHPRFFGEPFGVLSHRVLAGASDWTVFEQQLFIAFVSQLNECQYCVRDHAPIAAAGLGEEMTAAALQNWRDAPLHSRLRAGLAFLEKLTVSPHEVGSHDIVDLRAAAVNDGAIVDLVYLCAWMSIINRVANALEFEPDERATALTLKRIMRMVGDTDPPGSRGSTAS